MREFKTGKKYDKANIEESDRKNQEAFVKLMVKLRHKFRSVQEVAKGYCKLVAKGDAKLTMHHVWFMLSIKLIDMIVI